MSCMSDTDNTSLYQALFKAIQELKAIPKDANGHFGPYASPECVWENTQPILWKHGLFIHHKTLTSDGSKNILVTSLVYAETGEKIESHFSLLPDKPGPQGFGAAQTYQKRYATLNMLGLPTEGDPDATTNRTSSYGGLKQSSQEPIQHIVGDWEITFGKFKGKKFSQVSMSELESYALWLRESAKQKGEDLSKNARDYTSRLQSWKEVQALNDFAPNPETEIPF